MKKVISLLLIVSILAMSMVVFAEESAVELGMKAETQAEKVEVGDQFLVSIKKTVSDIPFLTFRVNGSFDNELAEIIAPVYSNEKLGILTNKFDNEKGTFTFEGYDQTLKGTKEDVICSILFEAKKSGEFSTVILEDCMLGKVGENAFYTLSVEGDTVAIGEDSDGEKVSVIKEPEPVTPFDDMLKYDWAEKAVKVMYDLGALEGIADKSYYPGENITRGDFITMLMRVCKQKKTSETIENFKDVDPDSYQYEHIMTAKILGIAQGDESGNFRPDEYITRQDICALVFRTMKKMNKVDPQINADKYISSFSDKGDIYEYAVDSVAGLIRAKLIIGDDTGLLRPKDNMTRAEAAVLLNRLAEFNILVSRG